MAVVRDSILSLDEGMEKKRKYWYLWYACPVLSIQSVLDGNGLTNKVHFLGLFILFCVSEYMYVSAPHICLVLTEVQRPCWIS